jgi:hypothetical protein
MAEWKYIQEVNTLSGKEYLNFINSSNCLQRKTVWLLAVNIHEILNIRDPAPMLFPITKEVEQHLIDYIHCISKG